MFLSDLAKLHHRFRIKFDGGIILQFHEGIRTLFETSFWQGKIGHNTRALFPISLVYSILTFMKWDDLGLGISEPDIF